MINERPARHVLLSLIVLFTSPFLTATELLVGKACPVSYQQQSVGLLVFSREWYHSSRSNAAYIASDNATGVGLEIHLFANDKGHVSSHNVAGCDRYRLLQVRATNARLHRGEDPVQLDVPDSFDQPFYDSDPLEHGRGVHLTPTDTRDKPWSTRVQRASTVAIYDTPYVSDAYGTEGEHIRVEFETCVVCQRDQQYDSILSCGTWGYQRDFMGGMTGWAEPEFTGVTCSNSPSTSFQRALERANRIDYSYWLNWRISSQRQVH